MTTLTVSSKGWVVIPHELRRKYGLRPGAQVQIVDYGNVLAIVPLPEKLVEEAVGSLAGSTALTNALLAEHAAELSGE